MEETRVGLVTFGDGNFKWSQAKRRLLKQGTKSNYFSIVKGYNLNSIKRFVTAEDLEFIESNSKTGFGYWICKPLSILAFLEENPEISYLVYLDAGSEISRSEHAKKIFEQYMFEVAYSGAVCFQLDNLEISWSKSDLIELLQATPIHINSGQIAGGHLILDRHFAIKLCNSWLSIMRTEKYRFLDDTPSRIPERSDFVAHRHDQSILSLLIKNSGKVSLRPASEMEPGKLPLKLMGPFIAARNPTPFLSLTGHRLDRIASTLFKRLFRY